MVCKNDKFWYEAQFKADLIKFEHKTDLSMGGILNNDIETRSCNKLIIVGPMLDGYITQLAKEVSKKLCRGRLTGIQESSNLYFPYSIFIQFAKLASAYGGTFIVQHGKKKGEITALKLTIKSEMTSKKIFHPKRLNGLTYLVKRRFKKVKGGKSTYHGHARVVVTEQTPIAITYKMKTMYCKMSYYIQRYNDLDEAVDVRLQALLNGV